MDRPAKIMVVDDEDRNLRLMEAVLLPRGYEVILAPDGETALGMVANESPDVILLDVMMPKMDGFEVCRRLKADPATCDIPVIFLTSKTDSESVLRGFESGGVDYVSKPFNKAELLARVQTHVELECSRTKLLARTIELTRANERLQELDQMKTDFLNMAAHDIRTPITSVVGFARMTQKKIWDVLKPETEATKRARSARQVLENIGIIISEGERLTALINDLLDVAKLESGKVELKGELLDLTEAIGHTLSATSALFEGKGLEALSEIDETLPAVWGDRDRIVQVLVNLVSNAVKFTPEKGRVTCRAEREPGNDGDWVRVSIIDNGIGIALEQQARVFEKFQQIDDGKGNWIPGTGLGLPICKLIVERHGGRIRLDSEPGRGSIFSFILPVNREAVGFRLSASRSDYPVMGEGANGYPKSHEGVPSR